MALGFFHGLGLVPVTGNLNSTAYNGILGNSVLPTLWQKFEEGLFLFQHDNAHFIVLMSSLLFYNVENSKNKEEPLKE